MSDAVVERHPDHPDLAVVTLEGEIDVAVAPVIAAEAGRVLDDGCTRLVFDLAEVTFLDSSGMGALIHVYKRALDGDGCLVLADVQPQVLQVLAISGLDRVFPIAATRAEAIQLAVSQ